MAAMQCRESESHQGAEEETVEWRTIVLLSGRLICSRKEVNEGTFVSQVDVSVLFVFQFFFHSSRLKTLND